MGASDPNFLGYEPLDPNVIGQSAWVEVRELDDEFEVTFVRGSGDCMAGCINREYARFVVSRDGAVRQRCTWSEGESGSIGTPC